METGKNRADNYRTRELIYTNANKANTLESNLLSNKLQALELQQQKAMIRMDKQKKRVRQLSLPCLSGTQSGETLFQDITKVGHDFPGHVLSLPCSPVTSPRSLRRRHSDFIHSSLRPARVVPMATGRAKSLPCSPIVSPPSRRHSEISRCSPYIVKPDVNNNSPSSQASYEDKPIFRVAFDEKAISRAKLDEVALDKKSISLVKPDDKPTSRVKFHQGKISRAENNDEVTLKKRPIRRVKSDEMPNSRVKALTHAEGCHQLSSPTSNQIPQVYHNAGVNPKPLRRLGTSQAPILEGPTQAPNQLGRRLAPIRGRVRRWSDTTQPLGGPMGRSIDTNTLDTLKEHTEDLEARLKQFHEDMKLFTSQGKGQQQQEENRSLPEGRDIVAEECPKSSLPPLPGVRSQSVPCLLSSVSYYNVLSRRGQQCEGGREGGLYNEMKSCTYLRLPPDSQENRQLGVKEIFHEK